jgi:methylamine dehydrogenase heavy chain
MTLRKCLLLAVCLPLLAAAADRPPLEPEISDVATMPAGKAHRFYATSLEKSVVIYDADAAKMEGQVPVNYHADVALAPDGSRIVVAETVYSHGNRGDRLDLLSIYESSTLDLIKDIVLPGRALADHKPQNLAISADSSIAYVYNMHPASSVAWVDLKKMAVGGSVEVPGCALVFPWGNSGFSSLCGDGSLATVSVGSGPSKVTHTKPFFDANKDPIFENSVVDPAAGRALFISYTGLVYPAKLGAEPSIEKPWSIQAAAGQPIAGTGADELAWRPGGFQLAAWHKASDRLFVLMHPGNFWSHKEPAAEIWSLDVKAHKLIKRIVMPSGGGSYGSIAVSQGASPQLYLVSEAGGDLVIDPDSGDVLRKIDAAGGSGVLTVGN